MVTFDSNSDDDKIRLVDDVFSKCCFMINDISVDVKVCASNLLGQIENVSSRFLLQTLDKKLMSDLKVRKFQKLRQKQLVSSDWTSAALPTSSSDSVITDEDNLNLLASGACGAFIHGLEDEFLEVRSEAVESLCTLALNCPKLAAKSIDFLVDMFNDEIEAVRLKAIQALSKITHYVLLGDDQIDIVLSVIEVPLNVLFWFIRSWTNSN
jgi:integrator complex subunit 4